MKMVLDTDVLLSGLRSATGASRVLLQAVEVGVLVPLVSAATVLEYEAVLQRPEQRAAMGLTTGEVEAFLDGLVALAEHVEPRVRHRGRIRDPDDEMFVEVAINGGGDAIVTFNVGDYARVDPLDTGFGIVVCRPGEIVRRLAWHPSAISRFGFLRH
jgi:putative PIN family toxin of toxin-antitoxin system